jgi:hypothetical protein
MGFLILAAQWRVKSWGERECITRVMTTTTAQGNERTIAGENLGDRHGRGAAQVAYARDVQALSGEKIQVCCSRRQCAELLLLHGAISLSCLFISRGTFITLFTEEPIW